MRHITPARLDDLESLLQALGRLSGLKEKKRGIYYRMNRAFLHFHEDGADIFADIRFAGTEFERHRCTSAKEQSALLKQVENFLAGV